MSRIGKKARMWECVDENGKSIAAGFEDEEGNAIDYHEGCGLDITHCTCNYDKGVEA